VPTAKRWADPYRQDGEAAMVTRSSRPHRSPSRTHRRVEKKIKHLRTKKQLGPAQIAGRLGMHPSTVHRVIVRLGLPKLVLADNRVYVDQGLTGTNRERPGLREVLAACREGDTLVVTKLDRLARSLPDARAIADELTMRQVRLNLGGSVYDPTDPVGRLLFNVLAMVAEFESDLIRLRTREGMKVAKG
jgi:Resolvase, N terminal domain/Homeodomain-like domain